MKIIIACIILVLLIIPVSATDYIAKFSVDKIENVNGVKTWASPQTFFLNKSDSKDYLGIVTITYFDIDLNSNPIQINIKTSGSTTSSFTMVNGETKNIKGSYYDNASMGNIDDIRIKLMELKQSTIPSTTINTTSDSVVYGYIFSDVESSLLKDDTVTFDTSIQKTSSDARVIYPKTKIKEFYVYFKRLQSIPIAVAVASKEEPTTIWDNDKIRFTITKSDTYVFTVKYNILNPWGASTETIVKYTLIVKGLELSSTTPVYSTTPYKFFVGDTETITMTEAGSFSPIGGASITSLTNTTYNIVFNNAGNYNLVYTTNNGAQTMVTFNIIQKPTSATQPQTTATVSANQAQNQAQGTTMGIDNIYLGILLIILVVGVVYINKNKNKNRSIQFNQKKNV